MIKLMHYEFRKTRSSKLLLLGITAVLELIYLFGLFFNHDRPLSIGVVLLTLTAIGGVIYIGIESVVILHRDMNTRQGYMLFMTPNSGYTILGAKVLENGLSILLMGAFFGALGMIDFSALIVKTEGMEQLWKYARDFLQSFFPSLHLDWQSLAALLFALLTGWLSVIVTAYLADIIASALLRGKRLNGLTAFIVFILLDILISWTVNYASRSITDYIQQFCIVGGLHLIWTALMYYVAARLMEQYLSV